ncbi:MAG TPA: hypothetical protein VFE50_00480 [Cyclobacteriaceae bacterium]|nr:hypothetical protein [Cyclobacteriaceae bacterium]
MAKHIHHILRTFLVLIAIAIVTPAIAQNTKGDRAVDNQRKVRETKGKSVKKKTKASTRDIAGRRLRTKNKSSANRANVGIPQPTTTARQPRRVTDRAAPAPASKRWASREARRSDPDRSWQGDISGSKPRRIRPKGAEVTGRNVYPQGEYATKQPMGEALPFKYHPNKTVSGRPIVKRTPKHSERAWKGDIKGQPFSSPRSATGQVSNVYRQKNKYSKYVSKRPSGKDVAFSNKAKLAKAAAMGTDTSPKNWKRSVVTATGQVPFVTRGRKNVYWGKIKIRERAKTKDMAGRPLYKRNFQSSGMGLTNRDTLAFFGRKPHGDVMGKGKGRKFTPGSEAKGGWLNDIAGYRLRKRTPQGQPTKGFLGFRSKSGQLRSGKLQGKAPGIGAGAIERHLNKTGGISGKAYGDQGGAYTGYLKAGKRNKFKGGAASALWNNNRTPIAGKALPGNAGRAGNYSGNLRGSGKMFGDQGGRYTGYLKAQKKGKAVLTPKTLWNNKNKPVTELELGRAGGAAGNFSGNLRGSGKMFTDQGGRYTGYLKAQKKGKAILTPRALWNNKNKPVTELELGRAGAAAGNFSGNMKGSGKAFNDQGGSYTGYLKARKKGKAILTPNVLWNNNGKSVTELEDRGFAAAAGTFQGRKKTRGPQKGKMLATPNVLWNNNGKAVTELEDKGFAGAAGTFQGRKKIRGDQKGKALLTPSVMWNNKEKAVTQLETTKLAAKAGYYRGNRKTRQQEKGKIMTSPNVLWNNNEKAVTEVAPTKSGEAAGLYQGRLKAKEPKKYPLNSNHIVWNNNGKATTQPDYNAAGMSAGQFTGKTKFHKESKSRDVEIEDRMKVKKQYTQGPYSVDEAIKKEKIHQATARRVDYQGNVKMRKFFDRRGESPDAKFINPGENNVKEDRTIITNVKLLWARLFQKSESQPANLKSNSNKLRYDKREKGLWAD